MMEFKLCLLFFVAVVMFNNQANGSAVPVKTYSGNTCRFPFVYKGVAYTECTTVDHPRHKAWCIMENEPDETGFKDMCIGDARNHVVDTYEGTGRGAKCHFPFTHAGKTYTGCTTNGNLNGRYWCSTTANCDADHKWGFCNVIDSYTNLKMPKGDVTQWEATTCVFPFVYKGETYHGCAGSGSSLWCSTTDNYDRDSVWRTYKWCDDKDILGTQSDARTMDLIPCVFPYIKDGKLMNDDIYVNGNDRMCSTTFNYDQDQRKIHTGRFKNLQMVQGLKQCFLPFRYHNVIYHGCHGALSTNRWCSFEPVYTSEYQSDPRFSIATIKVCQDDWVMGNARGARRRNQREHLA